MNPNGNTMTKTSPAFKQQRTLASDKHPITLEGIRAASQQLTQMVGDVVSEHAKRVTVKTISCEEGFFYYVEALK